jgi:hypothetical protein
LVIIVLPEKAIYRWYGGYLCSLQGL